jgi:putative endonuclease
MADWNVKEFYVYMMTNRSRIVLYTGVTNDLTRRVWEHKNPVVNGFTAKYKLDRLVYDEQFSDAIFAITRKKAIKAWRREKKNDLVRKLNPSGKTSRKSYLAEMFKSAARHPEPRRR